jgi:hypothetical protein
VLEVILYPNPNDVSIERTPYNIEVAASFLQWLAESDFMEIGAERPTEVEIDGDRAILNLVRLGQGNNSNRKRFRYFFLEAIVQESDTVLVQLGETVSKEQYGAITYKLRKLQQLRKCIENEAYQYLQRMT